MREESLIVKNRKKKKYNSYMGEISPAVENIIQRNFHAEKPNQKWLTDISEFHIPAGKIYLSPIIDCFDGLPISWTIGVHPDAELVNTMLDPYKAHKYRLCRDLLFYSNSASCCFVLNYFV